jgi:hypothetical protein
MDPLADPLAEGRRVAAAAAEQTIPLRLLGGVAIALRCPSSQAAPLKRGYADIDCAVRGDGRDKTVEFLAGLGYEPDREFNTLHGQRRLYFWDRSNERHLDVFVEEANLCHRISLGERIGVNPMTLSLADLTVLKLQVMETNEKDYIDLCALFADHELSEDESGINVSYITNLGASDWGLWRTMGLVAERSERFALELAGFAASQQVAERLRRLRGDLDAAPKTRKWKLRARVGERKRWYELPEEVH